MEFKVSELEKEPIEFDLAMPAGHIDFGEEAEQKGNLADLGTGGGHSRAPGAEGHCRGHPAAGEVCGEVPGAMRAVR